MIRCRKTFLTIATILFLINGCAVTHSSACKKSHPKNTEKGWVMMKDGNNKPARFFAIGTWHVPGYTFTNAPESNQQEQQKNEKLFRERTAPINMLFISPGQQKGYMSDKIHILNPLSPMLHSYLDRNPDLPDGNDKDYYQSQYSKTEVNNPRFIQYLDSQMVTLMGKRTNEKYIYSHIDEIALGGVSKWAIPPSVGALLTQRLKKQDPDALVFVDLVGHSKGSPYLFEKRYLETHKSMPKDPPYELAGEGARECKIPLLGFYQAYDGSPVYQFKDGNYSYTDFDTEHLRKIWIENTRIYAKAYKESGDVFGINAFRDFYADPQLAGITVDALKEGLGKDVPIWLYFDGNGYAKPGNVSPESYLQIVKCQIYTSIVHGATGILFWNDWKKTPEVFDGLLPILEELNKNMDVIKLDTYQKIIDGNKHILIKGGKKGTKYVIATNTSKTDPIDFSMPGGATRTLAPLEVYLSEW